MFAGKCFVYSWKEPLCGNPEDHCINDDCPRKKEAEAAAEDQEDSIKNYRLKSKGGNP